MVIGPEYQLGISWDMRAHLLPRERISAVWHVLSLSSHFSFHFVIAFVARIGKSALLVNSETAQKITVGVRRNRRGPAN